MLLRRLGPARCSISVLSRTEVLIGLRGGEEGMTLRLLSRYVPLDVDARAADLAAEFGRRHRATHGRKMFDLLLAATAVVHRLRLVTLNPRDFPMPEVALYPER